MEGAHGVTGAKTGEVLEGMTMTRETMLRLFFSLLLSCAGSSLWPVGFLVAGCRFCSWGTCA